MSDDDNIIEDEEEEVSDEEELEGEDEALPAPTRRRNPAGIVPEPETIGTLHFVANPEYPYPFKLAKPPRFWMEEQTGVLEDAVETYIAGNSLKPAQLAAIKIYLKQFVERAPLVGEAKVNLLTQKVDRLKTTRDIENFADEVAEFGAEVF